MFNFLKEDTLFSVRKFLAYASGLIFIASCVFTMIEGKGSLDGTQYAIIAGVFGFYFSKELFSKLTVSTKK